MGNALNLQEEELGCVLTTDETRQITAIIEREGDGYVALCPELDIASQGASVESVRRNLIEAVELFLETADSVVVQRRLHSELPTWCKRNKTKIPRR